MICIMCICIYYIYMCIGYLFTCTYIYRPDVGGANSAISSAICYSTIAGILRAQNILHEDLVHDDLDLVTRNLRIKIFCTGIWYKKICNPLCD